MTQPQEGWENPDHHPSLNQRPRPMFDPGGKPVTRAPEPEPLTPAELAMFEAAEDMSVVKQGGEDSPLSPGGIIHGPRPTLLEVRPEAGNWDPEAARERILEATRTQRVTVLPNTISAAVTVPAKLARIRELATKALDNPSPAQWAVALSEILRELDS